jgi:pyruvate/2-oxoglutarate dehydrogenase complex dihydrolipoamide acyltransferase (E2) component
MPTKVTMPQLGESVVEGTITRWLKEVGEQIDEYEPLLEVNTDKVDSEIPSPVSGTVLEILIPEGTTVQAGELLALIGEEDEQAAEVGATAETETASQTARQDGKEKERATAGQPAPEREAIITPGKSEIGFISPVVAKIASEHNLDLRKVSGTGQGGRITKKDVLTYLERQQEETPPEEQTVPSREKVGAPAQRPGETPGGVQREVPGQPMSRELIPAGLPSQIPGEVLPLTPVRRAIAEHMVLSKHTSPHVTTVMEADLSQVVKHRESNKETFSREGINLTFTAYFISAIVSALQAYPIVNSSWSEEGLRIHKQINIGMATALGEGGLIVPVIKQADSLSLRGLARTINDLATRARNKQLQPNEVKGGTFTLTNHGTSGSLFATPIINQPQCGILGVGAVQKRVVVIDDAIAIRPMAYLTLTFDHRILDGAIADYFLVKVVESLQGWRETS